MDPDMSWSIGGFLTFIYKWFLQRRKGFEFYKLKCETVVLDPVEVSSFCCVIAFAGGGISGTVVVVVVYAM